MSMKCIILAAMALLPFSMMIAAASEEQALLEAALSRGDECVGDGSDEQCTLAALQLRAQKAHTEEKKESGQEHDKKEGEISTKAASLDGTLVEKLGMYTAQPLCKGAGEGTICVPENSYLYCSVGQQLNYWNGHAGTVTCESIRGKMSWCLEGRGGGFILTTRSAGTEGRRPATASIATKVKSCCARGRMYHQRQTRAATTHSLTQATRIARSPTALAPTTARAPATATLALATAATAVEEFFRGAMF
eukprot:CAMPEP_0204220392 /NCGR_PEP_ID=MMETSP0361-20130328/80912_1 /ASSEMBLY_ACC=CAM_ASM_000343 /TAXON_ID=268821 /ORGANISM="Scrippsiella Hangoei, Strain SHTV-5" /LENGTH=248 /DNA_ID=CAMNT_0051185775 /DNA_START=19 /DNA_END=765 /DNA_ORIENTATION=-